MQFVVTDGAALMSVLKHAAIFLSSIQYQLHSTGRSINSITDAEL
jgi:hypothetical protein